MKTIRLPKDIEVLVAVAGSRYGAKASYKGKAICSTISSASVNDAYKNLRKKAGERANELRELAEALEIVATSGPE